MAECRKNGRKNYVILIALLLIGAALSMTLAYFTDRDESGSHAFVRQYSGIELNVVLLEPAWDGAENYPMQGLNSFPGDLIPADPTLLNVEEPAYLRLKVTLLDSAARTPISGERAELIWNMLRYLAPFHGGGDCYPMTEAQMQEYPAYQGDWGAEDVFFRDEGHELEDGYSYDEGRSDPQGSMKYFNFNRIMDTGENAVLYDYVVVPLDWDEEQLLIVGDFTVHIVGEAVHHTAAADVEAAMKLIHEAAKAWE